MRYSVHSLCVLSVLLLAVTYGVSVCDAGKQFNLSKPATAADSSPATLSSTLQSADELSFISFLRSYQKVYTADEFQRRFAIFSANLATIEAHNADQSSTHRLGITEHADWTGEEFSAYRLGYRRPVEAARLADSSCDATVYSAAVPAVSLDWRSSSAVSGVKNQGNGTAHTHTHINIDNRIPRPAVSPR